MGANRWQHFMIRAALLALTALAFGSAATSEDIDFTGTWSITTNEPAPCSLTGQATLAPSPDKDVSDYACELTMRHVCPNGFDAVVRQSCKVRLTGRQVTVLSALEEAVNGASLAQYAPDNFNLTIQSANELYGAHIDAYGSLIATWTRSEGSIS